MDYIIKQKIPFNNYMSTKIHQNELKFFKANFIECHRDAAATEATIDCPPPLTNQRIELLVSLMREFIQMKKEMQKRHNYPNFWERVLSRLETISLITFLFFIFLNVTMFMYAELWY